MFENINEDNVVEQTFDTESDSGSEISVIGAPATTTDNLKQNRDYLDPLLFNDVKTISIEEIDNDTDSSNIKTILNYAYKLLSYHSNDTIISKCIAAATS